MSALEPTGIDLQDSKGRLSVRWSDGSETSVPYRSVRLACHCAVCVDELTGRPLLDPGKVPADIGVVDCAEVGLYGIQITWSDTHSTGIFSWERLRELAAAEAPGA